ncbi:MAG: NADH:flavin oxidoreductase [Candidatus Lambdaproteobacteria bacterium]|nr:NADH:flavin oxidoreductase [Candidatus Lambdaproteobacteria bacterium]
MAEASLFEPYVMEHMQMPNRIVFAPFHENMANRDGTVSPHLMDYYVNMAREGVGGVLVESAYVATQGRAHMTQLGISEERHIEGLYRLVKAIQAEGAVVGLRLSHAGAKTSEALAGEQPIGPSVMNFGKDYDTCREFDEGDVEEIVLFFVHAAERAEEVEADFIEINGAQQFLLDQCLSTRFNARDDGYGGSIAARMQLSVDIVKAIKARTTSNIPISYLFTIYDKLEDGFTEEDLKGMLKALNSAKVDLLHPVNIHVLNKFFDTEETLAEWVAKSSKIPIMLEGNIKSPQILKESIGLRRAQLFALDKALFSRPNWYSFLQKKIVPG